jgi:hypothetical protein
LKKNSDIVDHKIQKNFIVYASLIIFCFLAIGLILFSTSNGGTRSLIVIFALFSNIKNIFFLCLFILVGLKVKKINVLILAAVFLCILSLLSGVFDINFGKDSTISHIFTLAYACAYFIIMLVFINIILKMSGRRVTTVVLTIYASVYLFIELYGLFFGLPPDLNSYLFQQVVMGVISFILYLIVLMTIMFIKDKSYS